MVGVGRSSSSASASWRSRATMLPVKAMVTCGVLKVGTTSKPAASRSATLNNANLAKLDELRRGQIVDLGVGSR